MAELQGLVGELEERLTEKDETHLSTLSHNQEEITRLNTQVHCDVLQHAGRERRG